jgi:hypothetical protein
VIIKYLVAIIVIKRFDDFYCSLERSFFAFPRFLSYKTDVHSFMHKVSLKNLHTRPEHNAYRSGFIPVNVMASIIFFWKVLNAIYYDTNNVSEQLSKPKDLYFRNQKTLRTTSNRLKIQSICFKTILRSLQRWYILTLPCLASS